MKHKMVSPTIRCSCIQIIIAFLLLIASISAQLSSDPQTYQPRYNPQYTNAQQNPPPGTTQYENPLLTSLQDQNQLGGNSNTLGGSSGQSNYNNYFDSNLNRQINSNSLGGTSSNYDPFSRNSGSNGFTSSGIGIVDTYSDEQNFCPEHWISFHQTCYRFIRSPKRNWMEAKKICKAYNSELINVDNIEKHAFVLKQLILQNQRQNRFWTSARQTGPNSWTNDDNSPFLVIEDAFSFDEDQAIENEDLHDNRFLVRHNYNSDFNRNSNQYYNTIGGSANRNQNNLRGLSGKYYIT